MSEAAPEQGFPIRKSFTAITAQPKDREIGLTEHKLFHYLLFRARNEDTYLTNQIHKIPMRDVQRYLGNVSTRKIIECLDSLTQLDLKLEYVADDGLHTARVRYLSYDATWSEDGYLRFAFDPFMWNFLADPDVYGLPIPATTRKFKSVYAAQLYDLLSAFRRRRYPVWEVKSMDHFRRCMRIPEGRLKRVDNLKRRAIEAPVEEINKLAEFSVSYEYIRGGRGGRTVGVIFQIHERQPEEIPSTAIQQSGSKRDTNTPDLLDGRTDVERFGLPPLSPSTLDQAEAMLDDDPERVQAYVEEWYRENAGASVRDPDGEFLLWLTNKQAREADQAENLETADGSGLEDATVIGLIDKVFGEEEG